MTFLAMLLILILSVWETSGASQAPAAAPSAAPQGNADNGKMLYARRGCWTCHGYVAQGGDLNPNATGPRLAGRTTSWPAFSRYVRRPTGNMIPYTEKVLPDKELAGIFAWLRSISSR